MDINLFMNFLWQNALFSTAITLIAFILGWILYDKVITGKINIKDALFEKDNIAAWIELIGAFIFPVLYLSAKAIEGSISDNIWVDLGICALYAVSYIIIFTLLRLSSGIIVKIIGAEDKDGKISLNDEIYKQKNIAAALFSVSLSIIFAGMLSLVDILPGYFITSMYKAIIALVFSLLTVTFYMILSKRNSSLVKEIFIDNNPAVSFSFMSFIFAIQIIIRESILVKKEFDIYTAIITSLLSIVIFGILSQLFKYLLCKIIKVDIKKEIYEDNNIGAAIGCGALYIGVALAIVNFMK